MRGCTSVDFDVYFSRSCKSVGCVLVTTPQGISTGDVRRQITFCHKAGTKIKGIVENMSGFICPTCKVSITKFYITFTYKSIKCLIKNKYAREIAFGKDQFFQQKLFFIRKKENF